MATQNDQFGEMRSIHCLLCCVSKPFKGFLSHIRQKHLNYHRYKCMKCIFISDNEEDSTLHSLEKNHYVKFDDTSYQEHLAVKIFQDCCRKQFAIQNEIEKEEYNNSGQTKRRRVWNPYSNMQKIYNPRKSEKTSNTYLPSSSKDEVNLQIIPENQRNYGIVLNSAKCLYDEEKSESRIHSTKIFSKATINGIEPCKLSESDNEMFYVVESFSDTLKNIKTISPDKLPNVNVVDNALPIEGKTNLSNRNSFDYRERTIKNTSILQIATPQLNTACYKCGKEVNASYIAKKTHALQFHFTQDDDPEISELLPATIKACFPHSLSWSDYQCTECGKALGTYSSRKKHVLKEHFYWSAICPLSDCMAVISALGGLEEHFKFEHNISKLKMSKGLKQRFRKMDNDRKNSLHQQLSHCFPCSLPSKRQVTFKESAHDSRHLSKSSITSVLSSLLHSEPNNAKKKNFAYSSSDSESSSLEDEDNSGIKNKEHNLVDQKSKIRHFT